MHLDDRSVDAQYGRAAVFLVKRLEDLRDMWKSVEAIPELNNAAYGAYMKSMEMYFQHMDVILEEMGYTASDK